MLYLLLGRVTVNYFGLCHPINLLRGHRQHVKRLLVNTRAHQEVLRMRVALQDRDLGRAVANSVNAFKDLQIIAGIQRHERSEPIQWVRQ